MAVLPLTEATTGILGNPLGAATPGGMGQILEILKLVRDISQSPLAATMAARFTGGQGNQGSQVIQSGPVIESGPHNVQPAPQLPPPPAAAPVLDEKKFIEMLMTPEGRAMMDKGLQQIKDLGGDMTISQMQELLKSGKSFEQK